MLMSFVPLVLLTEATGLVVFGLVIAWMAKFFGGFALDRTAKEFNLHPIFMVLGFLFLNANALMTYRILGNAFNRTVVKIIHFIFQLLAVISASFGLSCVFHFHNAAGIANMYSLHSWFGIATFAFFCLQLIFGFVAFLILGVYAPSSSTTLRKVYLHLHVYGGMLILIMAGITALLGVMEVVKFHIPDYSKLPLDGIYANVIGVFIMIFVALVLYILYNEKYKARAPNTGSTYEQQINIDKE